VLALADQTSFTASPPATPSRARVSDRTRLCLCPHLSLARRPAPLLSRWPKRYPLARVAATAAITGRAAARWPPDSNSDRQALSHLASARFLSCPVPRAVHTLVPFPPDPRPTDCFLTPLINGVITSSSTPAVDRTPRAPCEHDLALLAEANSLAGSKAFRSRLLHGPARGRAQQPVERRADVNRPSFRPSWPSSCRRRPPPCLKQSLPSRPLERQASGRRSHTSCQRLTLDVCSVLLRVL
jgi:hypothetical protein